MNIYLHKFLPLIVSPLFFVFFLLVCGLIFKSRKIGTIGIIFLIFFSLPIISYKLNMYLQKDYIPQDVSNINNSDAIVVLSGMVSTIKLEDKIKYEFEGAVDRILSGIELLNYNKAPVLILTRSKLPWQNGIPEGEYLKEFSIKLGVPEESILLTKNVQNTDDEAKSVKKLLNKKNAKIILVTSAFHMPRAQKVFEAQQIKVIPFAVDFKNTKKITFLDFIPSASGLSQSSKFVKEMIGRFYYELKY